MSRTALEYAEPSVLTARERDRSNLGAAVMAVIVFAGLAIYCAFKSASDIEADAVTHYMIARWALEDHIHLVSVWGRPLCTLLYVLPAVMGKQVGVRLMSLALALVIGLVTYRIAVRQKMKYPAIALVLLLAQPLFFIHAWSSLTEIPFAVFLTLAFWAYQRRNFFWMAVLISVTPLGRPEGFGFVLIAAFALLMHRKWWWLVILPLPFLAWNYAGWVVVQRPAGCPWWDWVHRNWPYSGDSMYSKGPLLKYVGRMPALVGPFAFPFVVLGTWLYLRAGGRKQTRLPVESVAAANESTADAAGTASTLNYASPAAQPERRDAAALLDWAPARWIFVPRDHLARCAVWIAVIPLLILVVHSVLHWTGKMGSSGELRYLVIVSPFWALLGAKGIEWFAARYHFAHPMRWVAIGSLLPVLANWHQFPNYEVPFPRYADDFVATAVADWYRADPCFRRTIRSSSPRPRGSGFASTLA